MKQLTQSEFKKNGKIYKNISSPATSGTQTQVTDLVYDGGVLKLSTDGGSTFVDVTTAQDYQIVKTEPTDKSIGKMVYENIEKSPGADYDSSAEDYAFVSNPPELGAKIDAGTVTMDDLKSFTNVTMNNPSSEKKPFKSWSAWVNIGQLLALKNYTENLTVEIKLNGEVHSYTTTETTQAEDGYYYHAHIATNPPTDPSTPDTDISFSLAPSGASLGVESDIDYSYYCLEVQILKTSITTIEISKISKADGTVIFQGSGESVFDITNLKIANGSQYKPLKQLINEGMQEKLTAGTGITIENNVVSANSPFKNSTFESTENGSSKEDTWKTTDPDTTLLMQHQNDNGHSGFNVSKNFVEVSSTLTTESGISSTSQIITNDTATLKSEDGAGNSKQFKMTPTEMLFSERPKVTTNGEASEDVAIKGDLQNYVPTQSEISSQGNADPNTALTWTINETLPTNAFLLQTTINFTANSENFVYIAVEGGILFGTTNGNKKVTSYSNTEGLFIWKDDEGSDTSAYRTITFETAPTGTLLEWLKTYAVPQGSLTKTYAQVTNENGAVSIRVFENGDADLQNLSVTKDGVTINGKKPLTSVQPLYKHELVIPYSFSVTDPANGTTTVSGSVIYHYLSNTGAQITSASAIDDNFMLSGGIGKNSANTVLLFDVNVTKAGSSITVEAVSASTMGYITGTVGAISDTVMQLI
jgi:hypothetical protein